MTYCCCFGASVFAVLNILESCHVCWYFSCKTLLLLRSLVVVSIFLVGFLWCESKSVLTLNDLKTLLAQIAKQAQTIILPLLLWTDDHKTALFKQKAKVNAIWRAPHKVTIDSTSLFSFSVLIICSLLYCLMKIYHALFDCELINGPQTCLKIRLWSLNKRGHPLALNCHLTQNSLGFHLSFTSFGKHRSVTVFLSDVFTNILVKLLEDSEMLINVRLCSFF